MWDPPGPVRQLDSQHHQQIVNFTIPITIIIRGQSPPTSTCRFAVHHQPLQPPTSNCNKHTAPIRATTTTVCHPQRPHSLSTNRICVAIEQCTLIKLVPLQIGNLYKLKGQLISLHSLVHSKQTKNPNLVCVCHFHQTYKPKPN